MRQSRDRLGVQEVWEEAPMTESKLGHDPSRLEPNASRGSSGDKGGHWRAYALLQRR